MKRILVGFGSALFALTLSAAPHGPHAWGDKDKDGKCDRTGQAVGQGRGQGRGQHMASKQGKGQGNGRHHRGCCGQGQGAAQQTTPAPDPKK